MGVERYLTTLGASPLLLLIAPVVIVIGIFIHDAVLWMRLPPGEGFDRIPTYATSLLTMIKKSRTYTSPIHR